MDKSVKFLCYTIGIAVILFMCFIVFGIVYSYIVLR